MSVALIIPCFNEAPRLAATFKQIETFFARASQQPVVVIFVDDGSTDNTKQLLNEFIKQPHPHFSCQLVNHEKNQGKGAAIMSGWKATDADIVGFSDADLAYGLEALWPSIEALKHSDVVIAKRLHQRNAYSHGRNLISRCLQLATKALTGVRATDPQSGWKFMTRQTLNAVLPKLTQTRFAFDLELLLLCQANQARIHEIALPFTHDTQSSVKTRDGLRYLTDLLAITDELPFKRAAHIRRLALFAILSSLALFGWIMYYGYFFSDDFTGLWYGKQVIENFQNLITLHGATFFSPVINGYYALVFGLFGTSAPIFFFNNILIHATVAWLTGLLALELTNSRLNAWGAALLVAISGSAYEAIVWVAANMHSIATLWMVAAVYACVRLYKSPRWSWLVVSLVCQALAYGTKEISIVLFPLLCVALWSIWRQKRQTPSRRVALFTVSSTLLWLAYAGLQFFRQQGGQTFADNNYVIGWQGLVRIPYALLDLFVPLQAVDHLLAPLSAAIIGVSIVGLVSYLGYRYRSLPLVPLAFSLCVIGILPTVFFVQDAWWQPLASRYTYLPHVGASLLVASIFVDTIKHNSRRAIHTFSAVLILVSISQFAFMLQAITTQYAYVYKTGSTLAYAASLLDPLKTPLIYVYPEHPFPGNQAHIIGALNVWANYKPEQIVFLKNNERAELSPAHMLLYWQPEHRQYELTSKNEIFEQLVAAE